MGRSKELLYQPPIATTGGPKQLPQLFIASAPLRRLELLMPRRYRPLHLLLTLFVAQVTLAAETSQIPDVLGQDISRFNELMSNPIAELRIEGALGARHLRLAMFEPKLIGLLKDHDPVVRQEAVVALSQCGTSDSIGHLIVLLSDPHWQVREHVRMALCRMTGQSFSAAPRAQWEQWWNATSIEQKQERLFTDLVADDPAVRHAAGRALRCLATQGCEDRILGVLQQGKAGREHAMLVEALDRIGTPKSMPYFLQRAGVGDRAAAWALGRRGGADAEEALLKGLARNWSLDFFLNLDRVRSTKCGPFLARLCGNFASLIRAGRGEDLRYPPSPLRRVSANLIHRSGKGPMLVDLILAEMEGTAKEDAIPGDLKPLFQDLRRILTPEFVREGFSHCDPLLGVLYDVANDPALAARLIPLLQSQSLLVRIYAGLTLGKLGAAEAVGPLLEVIREGYAFSDSTAPASAKHTVNILNVDGKPQRQGQTVRWLGYLCTALGHIGTDDARRALESLANDPDAPRDVRYGSVIGLGHVGSMESLPALRKAVEQDIIWMIRDAASQTIREIEIANRARSASRGPA